VQSSLGEHIRHLRRERSLTQTELGGKQYSKSYVSAMERGSITPSREALRFFAEQLAQPADLFEQLMQQKAVHADSSLLLEQEKQEYLHEAQQEVSALFNFILSDANPSAISLAREMLMQANERLEQQHTIRQARMAFLRGLIAQGKGDLAGSRPYFEYALALAPDQQQAPILDALGTNYYLEQSYIQAISYHQRARQTLQQFAVEEQHSDMPMLIELHCGHDYRALAQHEQARDHYEHAQQHLRSTHHLLLAAQLYLGLGYCTYATLYRVQNSTEERRQTVGAYEQAYQRAVSFLLQSRALYQASHDTAGVGRVRLMQAMILLDYNTWQQQNIVEKAKANNTLPIFNTALLTDAEEQCYQVLMEQQENHASVPEEKILLYTALAYLVRLRVQRAEQARLGGSDSAGQRELAMAASLCQFMLDAMSDEQRLWPLLQQVQGFRGPAPLASSPALPRLTEEMLKNGHNPLIQAEVYQAAGQLAQEMAKTATEEGFIGSCYQQADLCWRLTLSQLRRLPTSPQCDPGYLIRAYHRYINDLRERVETDPHLKEEIYPVLLTLLEDMLSFAQDSIQLNSNAFPKQ
jgi:transcriptional regulator with XRE-family HTH domain